MPQPFARARWGLLAALGALTAAGCGAPPPTPPSLTVYLPAGPPAAGWLPLYLAASGPAGPAWQWRQGPPPARPPGSWLAVMRPAAALPAPVVGYLSERSGATLLGPAPAWELGFRWTALRELPLATAGIDPFTRALLEGVLREHAVRARLVETLPPAAAPRLLRNGHLPWVLVPLTAIPAFAPARVLTYLGASTGPAPAWVLVGHGPELPAALARINRALTTLRAEPPARVARRVAAAYHEAPAAVTGWVAAGLALGVWPRLTYPFPAPYRRTLELLHQAPAVPPLNPAPAARALEMWP
ncbi:conserved protein of unknown function [Candidatus Hydrogenisulfobacillus filiaventi]|uniref:ABC transporter substrate-binding protein n=1 Tax=Candidatus Hydrogenisulfobacillus filiaventi TaxID=2707344 RepID=A0A6F8ZII2_9FIRM|nr:conserved protein of unknown function [Candidatus Hydrogenisulfobacillus filiaventi]